MEKFEDYIIEEPFDPQKRIDSYKNLEPEFWKKKSLQELSDEEWEALCDGCGKCCLNKLEAKNKIRFTKVCCRFFDQKNCLCKIYENRFLTVPDCLSITLDTIREQPRWLPKTCAYWLLDNGFDLPDWHPLITGRADSVHAAEMSLKERNIVSESGIENYENYVVDWPDL